MPRNKLDGKSSLYVGRRTPQPYALSARDWADIERDSRLSIPPALKDLLNKIIETLSKHGVDSIKLVRAREITQKVERWAVRTNKIREELRGKKNLPLPILNRRETPDKIIQKYFDPTRYDHKSVSAADLAHVFEGAIKLARCVETRIFRPVIGDLDFWLIWAALVVSALRKHDVSFARKTRDGKLRKQFRSEVIDFIYFLQKRLPHWSWARKEPASIRKALKHALPMARCQYIPALTKILAYWSAGQFDVLDTFPDKFSLPSSDFNVRSILLILNESSERLRE